MLAGDAVAVARAGAGERGEAVDGRGIGRDVAALTVGVGGDRESEVAAVELRADEVELARGERGDFDVLEIRAVGVAHGHVGAFAGEIETVGQTADDGRDAVAAAEHCGRRELEGRGVADRQFERRHVQHFDPGERHRLAVGEGEHAATAERGEIEVVPVHQGDEVNGSGGAEFQFDTEEAAEAFEREDVATCAGLEGVVAGVPAVIIDVVARAAGGGIVTLTAAHEVVAVAAFEKVVAVAAAEDVVTGATAQRVVAVLTDELIVAVAALDEIVTGAALDLVVADTAVDAVQPIATFDEVVAVAAVEEVVAVCSAQGVVARVAHEGVVAVAAVEDVVAGTAFGAVVTGATGESVVARAAEEDVVAVAAIDHVVAVAGVDGVVAAAAEDRVAAAFTLNGVVTVAAIDGVVAVAGPDDVVAVATVEGVVAAVGFDDVVAGAAVGVVCAVACDQAVVARAAEEEVVAFAGVEEVVAVAAIKEVVAGTAVERVVAVVAGEHVVALATGDRVVAGAAGDAIMAGAALDGVVALEAGEPVVAVAAEHGIVAVGAFDDRGGEDGDAAARAVRMIFAENSRIVRVGFKRRNRGARGPADGEAGEDAGGGVGQGRLQHFHAGLGGFDGGGRRGPGGEVRGTFDGVGHAGRTAGRAREAEDERAAFEGHGPWRGVAGAGIEAERVFDEVGQSVAIRVGAHAGDRGVRELGGREVRGLEGGIIRFCNGEHGVRGNGVAVGVADFDGVAAGLLVSEVGEGERGARGLVREGGAILAPLVGERGGAGGGDGEGGAGAARGGHAGRVGGDGGCDAGRDDREGERLGGGAGGITRDESARVGARGGRRAGEGAVGGERQARRQGAGLHGERRRGGAAGDQLGGVGGAGGCVLHERGIRKNRRRQTGRAEAPQAAVVAVGDKKRPAARERDVGREVELRAGARAVGVSTGAAGHGGDHAFGGHFADAVIAGVGDVEVAGVVAGEAARLIKLRGRAGAVGRTEAAAGEGGHLAVDHAAQAAAEAFEDHEFGAGRIHPDARGIIQARAQRLAVATGEARVARAGDGGDGAVGRDLADALILIIGDINIARSVERHAAREVELRAGGGAIGEAGGAVARDGAHDVVGADDADAVVARIRDVDPAAGVDGEAIGAAEARRGACAVDVGRAVVAGEARDGVIGVELVDAAVAGEIHAVVGADGEAARVVGGELGAHRAHGQTGGRQGSCIHDEREGLRGAAGGVGARKRAGENAGCGRRAREHARGRQGEAGRQGAGGDPEARRGRTG